MEAVYEGLPADIKERIDGLRAVHDFVHTFGLGLSDEERTRKQAEFPPASHPIVRTHPETKRACLYVNRIFTSHIEGVDREESEDLLDFLYREIAVPEYQVRFKWAVNSVAFWDNRSTQHLAASDYWPRTRVMERITIIGDRPYLILRSASSRRPGLAFGFLFVLVWLDQSVGFQVIFGCLTRMRLFLLAHVLLERAHFTFAR